MIWIAGIHKSKFFIRKFTASKTYNFNLIILCIILGLFAPFLQDRVMAVRESIPQLLLKSKTLLLNKILQKMSLPIVVQAVVIHNPPQVKAVSPGHGGTPRPWWHLGHGEPPGHGNASGQGSTSRSWWYLPVMVALHRS